MSDPASAILAAAAKYVALKGLEFIATKLYEGSPCADLEHQTAIATLYCMAIRGAGGIDEKEYKQRLATQVGQIVGMLGQVQHQVEVINQNVTRLLKEMDLVHLEIGEVLVGAYAYAALQDIRVQYNGYLGMLNRLQTESVRATAFSENVIHSAKLHEKVDAVIDALINPLAGKPGLLENTIGQITNKGATKGLLDCYDLYEDYVTSILLDVLKGKVVFENAVQYLEIVAAEKHQPDLVAKLPYSTASWKEHWQIKLEEVLGAFNSHLERFVLARSFPQAQGINPFFLPAGARTVFWRADALCCRFQGSHGLRGRIFSMGDQFDGTLKLDDGTTVAGTKSEIRLDKALDYWTITDPNKPGVYDKIDFSRSWKVHRFHLKTATFGTKKLNNPLPYTPPDIKIGKYDAKTLQPSDKALSPDSAVVEFGSFVEIARAGGGFAFVSGTWEKDREDKDSSNKSGHEGNMYYPPGASPVTELQVLREEPIREREDRHIIVRVQRPEVGLSKGGSVKYEKRARLAEGRDKSHLTASFRTWLQTAKTITFPVPPKGMMMNVVVSLAPTLREGESLPGADTLNSWLRGATLRPLKPSSKITQEEVLSKQVIVGVNYDPTLASPDQGCALKAGLKFYPVLADKNQAAGFEHTISEVGVSCGPTQRGVFREGPPGSRSRSFLLNQVYAEGGARLKFRLEAFYQLKIETSGLDDTPFAIYTRGALDNVYVELVPIPGGVVAPGLYYDLKNPADRGFAFDYDGTGQADHLVLYRPGAGLISVIRHLNGRDCLPVAPAGSLGRGIGGYDLKSPADRAFAFDFNGSGKQDHLVFYRPGQGAIFILKHTSGAFTSVYTQGDGGGGIGGYDLKNAADRIFAFDFDGSGKQDHLVLYRPGAGIIYILKNNSGAFLRVYSR